MTLTQLSAKIAKAQGASMTTEPFIVSSPSGLATLKLRTNNAKKERLEDHELSDLVLTGVLTPATLGTNMYVLGYKRKDRGWIKKGSQLDTGKEMIEATVITEPSDSTGGFVDVTRETRGKRASETVTTGPAAPTVTPTQDGNLEDNKTQLREIATGLGINARSAAAMANFLVSAYDVNDPEQVWEGLKEVTEVHPSMRKRFWRTWTSFIGSDVPEELLGRVEQQTTSLGGGTGKILGKRYIAIDGEVIPADADDDSGVSYSQALQQARLQIERHSADVGASGNENTSIAVSVVGALSEIIKSGSSGGGNNNTELMLKVIEAKNELITSQLAMAIEKSNTQTVAVLKEFGEAMKSLAVNQGARKSWVDELLEVAQDPNRGRVIKSLLGISEAPALPGVTIALPGVKGADGSPIGVPIDSYMKIRDIDNRQETVKAIREGLPNLFKIGADIARAMNINAQAQKIAAEKGISLGQEPVARKSEPAEPEPEPASDFDSATMNISDCSGCGARLAYPKDAKSFGCPRCETVNETKTPAEPFEPASPASPPRTITVTSKMNGHTDPRHDMPVVSNPRPKIRPIITRGV